MNEQIKDAVKEYLSRDDVEYAIGYEKGTYGFRVKPSFAYTGADVDKFIFTPLCTKNLMVYPMLKERLPLPRGQKAERKKIVLVLKGCDSRALVQIIKEKGLSRDDVIIIGVSCGGMADPRKIEKMFPGDTGDIQHGDGKFIVTVEGDDHEVSLDSLLLEKCKVCENPTTLIHDKLIGDEVEAKEDNFGDVMELENRDREEKWTYWKEEFDKCIRCYACRNVCPLCYCKKCIVEELKPMWIRRSVDISENSAWNLIRAFHLAGRCADCGECELACPMDLPLRELNRKMAKDVFDMFKYKAGTDGLEKPLLTLFKPDDPEEFME